MADEIRGFRPILVPGRNCWVDNAEVHASGLLIDGREYYRGFYRAARQARRYIFLAGWKFNTDVRLLRGKDAAEAGEEAHFLEFLKKLCEDNPELEVYVLAWNFSLIYFLEWEKFLKRKFEKAHSRIHFCFDARHPFGGSHHQKFSIIDGHTAFVGGLDFNVDDWDDRNHKADNGLRTDAGEEQHGPYHDTQACLVGPVAEHLARYFQARWETAGGGKLTLPEPVPSPVPAGCPGLPLPRPFVALSRNDPAPTQDDPHVQEIRDLYLDAFAAAEKLIYIENQYFSSWAIGEALETRLRDPGRTKLDIVMVMPKCTMSWFESTVMEPCRLHRIESLKRVARETGHNLGIYYSSAGGNGCTEVPALIHSKLLIVDDRFLTVGSANLSNRSMGLDSELNVSWESTPDDIDFQKAVRRIRTDLLSEHTGLCGRGKPPGQLDLQTGLVQYLNQLAESEQHKLRILTPETIVGDRKYLWVLKRLGIFLDPDQPLLSGLLGKYGTSKVAAPR